MFIKTLERVELFLYDELIEKSNNAYIFQTRTYLDALSKLNQSYEIVGVFDDEVLVYALPVQKKKLPLINRYYYFIPYGIITYMDNIPNEVINIFTNLLKKKGIIIKLSLNKKQDVNSFNYLKENTTLMIDLNNELDLIFSNFSKTHRNCTRRAEKEGVIVKFTKDTDFINTFLDMYYSLTKEKHIEAISKEFLNEVLTNLLTNNLGFFSYALYNDKIQNIAFIATLNNTARYLYGSSIRTEEKIPPIGQYLHYEIIKHLKDNNFKYYDFGGIPNLPVEEDDPSYLVYKFKKGFGGEVFITHHEYSYYKFKLLNRFIK